MTTVEELDGQGGAGFDEYRFGGGVWGAVNWPAEAQIMIDACALRPQDVLMVDLLGERFHALAEAKPATLVKRVLSSYRSQFGDEPLSLLRNPGLDSSLPSLDGLRYAAVSATCANDDGSEGLPGEVFVDLVDGRVSFDRRAYVLDNLARGHTASLSAASAQAFLGRLDPLLGWGQPWAPVRPVGPAICRWQIAVVAADAQLYRWRGCWRGSQTTVLAPNGFIQVYAAFWDLAT